MPRPGRSLPWSLAVAFLVLVAPRPLLAAGGYVEKDVAVPRETRIALDITHEKATIFEVESQNDPKGADVEEALKEDPKDKTFVLLRFHYRNEGYVSRKVKLRVVLLDGEGAVLSEGGRGGTLDANAKDDTISFPIKVKTLDWPKATKLKVTATFLD
jgi:hypothetical protein